MVVERNGVPDDVSHRRVSEDHARQSLAHLARLAPNILAVLFNVYGETSTQKQGLLLSCIDSYLSITAPQVGSSCSAVLDTH